MASVPYAPSRHPGALVAACPECDFPLRPGAGCVLCPACGYSPCG